MELIKVGYCVAYDWYFLENSIPQVYDHADLICLSLDKSRLSWAGKPFSWDQKAFEAMLNKLDPNGRIKLFEADFYQSELLPMQNEVRQRNMIADFMGQGGWHIQLDADEYFVDFKNFVKYLHTLESSRKINVCCPLINLYKKVPDGFLWIKPNNFSQIEFIQIATKFPLYEHGRKNGYFNVLTDCSILHQSWARTDREVWEKLDNWGHKLDFDIQKYYRLWQNSGLENYKTYINFHHLKPEAWPSLELITGKSIPEMLEAKEKLCLPINKMNLTLSNSIWVSRLKKALNILGNRMS